MKNFEDEYYQIIITPHNGSMSSLESERRKLIKLTQELLAENERLNTILTRKIQREKYGAAFTFETGEIEFVPLGDVVKGIRRQGNRPISYSINFNEYDIKNWLKSCDVSLKLKGK
jgi:hypothetical protein